MAEYKKKQKDLKVADEEEEHWVYANIPGLETIEETFDAMFR